MNLIDLLKSQAGEALINHASSFLDESPETAQKAFDGIIPSLLGGIVQKGMSKGGGNMLLDLLSNNNLDGTLLNNVSGMLSSKKSSILTDLGGTLLTQLFGSKTGSVANLIGEFTGMHRSKSNSMMSMAMPLIMSLIGKQIKGKGLSALTNLLSSQTGHIKSAMPAGLSGVADLLGFGDGFDTPKEEPVPVAPTPSPTPAPNSGGGMGWLPWVIGLAAIAGLIYYMGGCGSGDPMQDLKDKANEAGEQIGDAANNAGEAISDAAENAGDAISETAGDVADAAGDAVDAAGEAISDATKAAREALANISFTAGSAGEKMYNYLKGEDREEGASFRFNNVNFASGSADLTPESAAEIDNLAAVLKAYPKVTIEVQGYTDNTGNAQNNVELSKKRAEAVRDHLMTKGIGAGRITAAGFGDANPSASNDTAEGRAQNRRIEVKVTN